MARVDFYVLEQQDQISARHHFACRLTDKAFRMGNKVYLHVSSAEEAQQLDDLLWTFKEDSFVPHSVKGEPQPSSVEIGFQDNLDTSYDLLINLTNNIPIFFNKFDRISEIVIQKEDILDASRLSYKSYKEQGHTLHLHKIKPT